jgi:hypothetical protein
MSKVQIEVDKGDAQAAYVFLRQSVQKLVDLTRDMPADRQEVYLDQPVRWDRVAMALGEAAGEPELETLIPTAESSQSMREAAKQTGERKP